MRSATGNCKQLDDCTAECEGGEGTRDKILGVCACANQPTTDELCNQECRLNAPVAGFTSPSKVSLTDSTGAPTTINLAAYGEVFGEPTGTGNTRAVSMGGDAAGFSGSYDMPAALVAASDDA